MEGCLLSFSKERASLRNKSFKLFVLCIIFMLSSSLLFAVDPRGLAFDSYDVYALSKDNSTAWNNIIKNAYAYIDNYDYQNAESSFQEAVELGCKSNQIIKDLFLCYINDNTFDWGIKHALVSNIISMSTKDDFPITAYKIIGDIFYDRGYENEKEFDLMILYYKKANAENEALKILAVQYFLKFDYEKALSFYKQIPDSKKVLDCESIIGIQKSHPKAQLNIEGWDSALMLWKNPYLYDEGDVFMFLNVNSERWNSKKEFYGNCWRYQTTYYMYVDIGEYNASDIRPSFNGLKCIFEYLGVVNGNFPKFKILYIIKDDN